MFLWIYSQLILKIIRKKSFLVKLQDPASLKNHFIGMSWNDSTATLPLLCIIVERGGGVKFQILDPLPFYFEKSTTLKRRKNFKQNFVNLTADSIDKIFAKVTLRLWPWLRQNVTVTEKAKPNANLYKQISDDMQEKRSKRKNLLLATYSRRTLQLK